MRYAVNLTPDENGTVIAEIPDLPGTFTFGTDESDALDMALDAALTMLSAMMDDNEDIPLPSDIGPDAPFIELPPMAVVKLAIYQGMRDQGVSQLKMAARLHTDPKSVRRLLDLYHRSKWDHLEMALEALGYRAVVRVEPSPIYPGFFGGKVKERVVG
ncbi:type II toxin-antitoxin system HicB family antitoxin [Desulfolutivibrio sulfoxidireducens]|uniref:type II toxin-antitoxin system HicB family antitoxin n=1 Tax=Desulfolutivibrio sulfoxidireducens TaxID=2773299 RepID=UPI00159D1329|nr:type II toxin-antitoxin system HicB family antitoxin [Desulfolutivibrio sulfoxidireducens]QLA20761.1 type II toxin-antitoxin system HicB family antitoxin [Desulfolutivibrio sulfoxidireducens]